MRLYRCPISMTYHCHILKHEDEGMMGKFLIVELVIA
ncbi:multicopper oxidase domain-containing protein [Ornithinibacillus massiliensis]|uniref:Multicopper oxidase domain-containing protein n=1 Tax=Ornithinibacillus massiliensis TaxID=1944633 RepID=A0ABS5M8W4_9BACI|nr:multicopper oxidase domain-containing protein [Ornithinibacillus massiliensis]